LSINIYSILLIIILIILFISMRIIFLIIKNSLISILCYISMIWFDW